MIAAYPLGVGSNNWDVVAERQAEQGKFREEWFYFVHNKYFLVLAEIGWIGLFTFVSFLVSILVCGRRACVEKRSKSTLTPVAVGIYSRIFRSNHSHVV